MNQEAESLEQLLDQITDADADGGRVSIGAILEAVGRRSFGPLLLVAGLITRLVERRSNLLKQVAGPDRKPAVANLISCNRDVGSRSILNHLILGGKDMFRKPTSAISVLFALSLTAAAAFAFTAEQAARGQEVYGSYCAACHGADAKGATVPERFGKLAGRKVPALAGKGALSRFKDAGQVYEFAKKNMPGDKPGSLAEDQYLAVVSFALQANGLQPDDQPLTPESAKNIKLSGGK